jgi:2-iminobutanoate/2-iminopropanoate deaminase
MTLRLLARVLLLVILTGAGACKNTPTTKTGLPWWPQGPGNPPGSEQASAPTEQGAQSAPPAAVVTPTAAPRDSGTQARAAAAAPVATASGAAQATRYGDLLFLSGQIAAHGGIEQQTHAVMQNIGTILESHRLTMANVVQVTVQLANIKDLGAMDAAYASHFRGTLPARSVVEVAHLPGDALVQIAVIAGR